MFRALENRRLYTIYNAGSELKRLYGYLNFQRIICLRITISFPCARGTDKIIIIITIKYGYIIII